MKSILTKEKRKRNRDSVTIENELNELYSRYLVKAGELHRELDRKYEDSILGVTDEQKIALIFNQWIENRDERFGELSLEHGKLEEGLKSEHFQALFREGHFSLKEMKMEIK